MLASSALDLSKDSKRNYGDEIAYQMRLARKKRWNVLEEKRIKEEIELQSYLNGLILNDKERQIEKLQDDIKNSVITDDEVIQNLEHVINTTFDERLVAVNDLFSQIDDKRRVSSFFAASRNNCIVFFHCTETRSARLLMWQN